MVHQLSRRKAGGLRCAILCALCAFLSFTPFLFRDGGFFHVWADFNSQQIPFGMALHHALEDLNPGGWTWSYELGMSTIQAFSFYGMGSPFYWISLLFPAAWYPYLTGWIYILKYTVAGVTAYYYIRRFTKGENSAAAGALMYAFSAFQATNLMYFHFHDVAALFPLLLTGLEKTLENPRDRGLLVFAVFINALNNYYFFVLEAVFTVMQTVVFHEFCQCIICRHAVIVHQPHVIISRLDSPSQAIRKASGSAAVKQETVIDYSRISGILPHQAAGAVAAVVIYNDYIRQHAACLPEQSIYTAPELCLAIICNYHSCY